MARNQKPPHSKREGGGERRAPTIQPRPDRKPGRRVYKEPDKKNDPTHRKATGLAEPAADPAMYGPHRRIAARKSFPEEGRPRRTQPVHVAAASALAAEKVKDLEILVKPIISEKSLRLVEDNVYTLEVDPRANKTQIKTAFERRFKVKVRVNTLNRRGKPVRTRDGATHRKSTKRAIVTLLPGSKPIDLFDLDS